MEYRVAVVQAAAGWGKTTSVRAAVAGIAHVWYDAATMGCDELTAMASSGDRLIVVDNVHAIVAGGKGFDTIAKLIDRFTGTRWVLISRRPVGLALATWIAKGEASAPVGLRRFAFVAARNSPCRKDPGAARRRCRDAISDRRNRRMAGCRQVCSRSPPALVVGPSAGCRDDAAALVGVLRNRNSEGTSTMSDAISSRSSHVRGVRRNNPCRAWS